MGTPFKLKKGGAKKAIKDLFNFNAIKRGAENAIKNGFTKGAKKAKK